MELEPAAGPDDEPAGPAVTDAHFALEWTLGDDGVWRRTAARVLVLAGEGRAARLLLVRGHDADDAARSWWFTVGGGIGEGEDPASAALRELVEETGIVVAPDELVGPVFSRSAVFDFFARTCHQDELLYLVRLGHEPATSTGGWTALEGQTLDELAWWALPDLAEAERSGVEVYPRDLAGLVEPLLAGWDGVLRTLTTGP